jgi:hypothetical protein
MAVVNETYSNTAFWREDEAQQAERSERKFFVGIRNAFRKIKASIRAAIPFLREQPKQEIYDIGIRLIKPNSNSPANAVTNEPKVTGIDPRATVRDIEADYREVSDPNGTPAINNDPIFDALFSQYLEATAGPKGDSLFPPLPPEALTGEVTIDAELAANHKTPVQLFDASVEKLALFLSQYFELAIANPDMRFTGMGRRNTLNKLLESAKREFDQLQIYEKSLPETHNVFNDEFSLKLEMLVMVEKLASNAKAELSRDELFNLKNSIASFEQKLKLCRDSIDPKWALCFDALSKPIRDASNYFRNLNRTSNNPSRSMVLYEKKVQALENVKHKSGVFDTTVAQLTTDFEYMSKHIEMFFDPQSGLEDRDTYQCMQGLVRNAQKYLREANTYIGNDSLKVIGQVLNTLCYVAKGPSISDKVNGGRIYNSENITLRLSRELTNLDSSFAIEDYAKESNVQGLAPELSSLVALAKLVVVQVQCLDFAKQQVGLTL